MVTIHVPTFKLLLALYWHYISLITDMIVSLPCT